MSKKEKVDPRVVRTKRMLTDALIALIEEQGFEKVTVQAITKKAMLNRATFYLHFTDKYDLLEQSTDDMIVELKEAMKTSFIASKGTYAAETPNESFIQLFTQIGAYDYIYRVLLSESTMPHFRDKLTTVLSEFIADGMTVMQPDDNLLTIPREMAIRFYASAFLGVIIWWLKNDCPYTAKYMAAQLMKVTIQGPYKQIVIEQKPSL
ncbi:MULTISPECIES: TetR/AcrR family transcriptional regulator [Cytobacillus]|uniref:TetR/AcrR family transcriptional regulator n=1 Tax=Cytobacillus stercorigallinarum TaxID=2762240 RepID=A0ABR8QL46_9BACI|nr:TetR/AcrR family transcriptional regulator [Cytobacillus stercorigallinarum]MBD7936250.1 TetR/AcrR family transcriptional regulator [Cytobacillus stercorigallinarum]